MAEYYPDTIEVDSSNLSAITKLRFNSMEEICCYKAEVVGSIPATATNWFVTQLVSEYPAFNGRVVSSSLTGPTNCLNGYLERFIGLTGLEQSIKSL